MGGYIAKCCPLRGQHIRSKLGATEEELIAFDKDCERHEDCGDECELYDVSDKDIEDCFRKWLKAHRNESEVAQ